MAKKRWRYSELNTYGVCPLQHHYEYVEARPSCSGEPALSGVLVHDFAALYTEHLMETKQSTDLSVLHEIADKAYEQLRREENGLDTMNLNEFIHIRDTECRKFIETHVFEPGGIIDVEHRWVFNEKLEPTTLDSDDAWFAGTLDLQEEVEDNCVRITDYKTGHGKDPNPLQARVYAWATFLLYPHIESVEFIYDFTRFQDVHPPIYFGRGDFDALNDEIQFRIKTIAEDTDPQPTPGVGCDYCQFRKECEYSIGSADAPENDTEAGELIAAVVLLEKDLKDRRKLLQTYCDQNGRVEVHGLDVGYHTSGDDGFKDVEAFCNACVEEGIEPWKYLSVASGCTKLRSKDGEWPEALVPHVVNKRSRRYAAKKIPKLDDAAK